MHSIVRPVLGLGIFASLLVFGPSCVDQEDNAQVDTEDSTELPSGQTRGPCDPSVRLGKFELANEQGYNAISGSVTGEVVPGGVMVEILSSESCRVYRQDNPFCDPPCLAGNICGQDGSCFAYPENQNVGTVFVTGLFEPVEMTPTQTGNRYFDTSLPDPAYVSGDPIELVASGGDLEGFHLFGVGVDPLQLIDAYWAVSPGTPIEINWHPGGQEAASIYISISVDQHGLSPGLIVCEAPDTGSLTIPSQIVDSLIELGVSGFPSGNIYRQTVDSAQLKQGCVEFAVYSHQMVGIQVDHPDSESAAPQP